MKFSENQSQMLGRTHKKASHSLLIKRCIAATTQNLKTLHGQRSLRM